MLHWMNGWRVTGGTRRLLFGTAADSTSRGLILAHRRHPMVRDAHHGAGPRRPIACADGLQSPTSVRSNSDSGVPRQLMVGSEAIRCGFCTHLCRLFP